MSRKKILARKQRDKQCTKCEKWVDPLLLVTILQVRRDRTQEEKDELDKRKERMVGMTVKEQLRDDKLRKVRICPACMKIAHEQLKDEMIANRRKNAPKN